MSKPKPEEAQDAWGASCGSGGEFFQGFVHGRWLQVACPVNRWRWARIARPEGQPGTDSGSAPDLPLKVKRLHERFTERGILPAQVGRTWIRLGGDELLPGSGMGSSTADLGALIGAVHAWTRRGEIDPSAAAAWALEVEPTNGTFYRELTLFDHRSGSFAEPWGAAPELDLVAVTQGALDTVDFNRRLDRRLRRGELTRDLLRRWAETLALLRRGLDTGDLEAVGRASTQSARLSRALAPRPLLEEVEATARDVGALGVLVGHSGTATGILLHPARSAAPEGVAEGLRRRLPEARPIHLRTGAGGIRWGTVPPSTPLPPPQRGPMV